MSDTSVVPQEQSLDVCSGKVPEASVVMCLDECRAHPPGCGGHEAEGRASKRLKEGPGEEKGVLTEGQLTPRSPAGGRCQGEN